MRVTTLTTEIPRKEIKYVLHKHKWHQLAAITAIRLEWLGLERAGYIKVGVYTVNSQRGLSYMYINSSLTTCCLDSHV